MPIDVLEYRAGFFTEVQSKKLLQQLIKETPWQQRLVKMYDKEIHTPRLTAWYGDPEIYDYTSSGNTVPLPWTPELLFIKNKVETVTDVKFNSVLLNYYRDENDSVAWQSDHEKALGTRPLIASVTFGEVRLFDIRKKTDHREILGETRKRLLAYYEGRFTTKMGASHCQDKKADEGEIKPNL